MAYKEINIEFKGYRRKPKISSLPDESGVYCVYTCTYDKQEKTVSLRSLLYIGESEDINDRIGNHERWDDWEDELDDDEVICFSYATLSANIRKRAEAALIYKHEPPLNTEFIDSFPFDETKITTSGKSKFLATSFVIERDD